jgi:hypothetical protein
VGDSRDLAVRVRRLRSLRGALAAAVTLGAALAVALLAASPSPARADRESGPVAVVAFGSAGGVETATNMIPASGSGAVLTDQLPTGAKQAAITVAPVTGTTPDPAFEGLVDTVVANYPKLSGAPRKAQRIITCAVVAAIAGRIFSKDGDFTFNETDPTVEAVVLQSCLRVAVGLSRTFAPNAANPASAACRSVQKSISIRITQTSSGYTGQVNGRTHKPSSPSPVVVACQRTATGLQLMVRPRAHGLTLPQVVGPNLGIAFSNRSNKSVGVRVTFTVR